MIANKIPRMATSTNDDPGSGPRPETQGRNTCRISEFCSRAMSAALVRGPARRPPQPPKTPRAAPCSIHSRDRLALRWEPLADGKSVHFRTYPRNKSRRPARCELAGVLIEEAAAFKAKVEQVAPSRTTLIRDPAISVEGAEKWLS
jgi:hypothetical protein